MRMTVKRWKKNQVTTCHGISSINAIWSKCNITPNIYLYYRPICRFFFHIPSNTGKLLSVNSKKLFAKKRRTVKVNSRKYLNLTYSTIQNNQEVEDSVKSCKVRACVSHVLLSFFFFLISLYLPRKTSMSDVHKAPQMCCSSLRRCFCIFRFLFLRGDMKGGSQWRGTGFGGGVWFSGPMVVGHSLQWS